MFLAHTDSDKLRQIARQHAHRLTFVAEALRFPRERIRHLEVSSVRLADREAERVMQTTKTEVPADRNVVALPQQGGVVVRDALCPVAVGAPRATGLGLLMFEQPPLIG